MQTRLSDFDADVGGAPCTGVFYLISSLSSLIGRRGFPIAGSALVFGAIRDLAAAAKRVMSAL